MQDVPFSHKTPRMNICTSVLYRRILCHLSDTLCLQRLPSTLKGDNLCFRKEQELTGIWFCAGVVVCNIITMSSRRQILLSHQLLRKLKTFEKMVFLTKRLLPMLFLTYVMGEWCMKKNHGLSDCWLISYYFAMFRCTAPFIRQEAESYGELDYNLSGTDWCFCDSFVYRNLLTCLECSCLSNL